MIQRTGADELMITANIFNHDKRKRSFEIVVEVHRTSGNPKRTSEACSR
jgi:hypothetical protein